MFSITGEVKAPNIRWNASGAPFKKVVTWHSRLPVRRLAFVWLKNSFGNTPRLSQNIVCLISRVQTKHDYSVEKEVV